MIKKIQLKKIVPSRFKMMNGKPHGGNDKSDAMQYNHAAETQLQEVNDNKYS